MRNVVLDTETTGFDFVGADRLIEIGCVELDGIKSTGVEYHAYINPRVHVHPNAYKVHGISDAFLSDKPEFEDIADDLMSFLAGATLIVHNSVFDIGFINKELALLEWEPLKNDVVDTLVMARRLRPGKRNSLDALVSAFKLRQERTDDLHGAIVDARLLAKVYCHMVQTNSAGTLELLSADPDGPVESTDIRTRVVEATPEEIEAHRAACLAWGIRPF